MADNLATIATAVGTVAALVGAGAAGIVKGLKMLREMKPANPIPGSTIAAASIIETMSVKEWTATNLEVVQALRRCVEGMDDLRRSMVDNCDELRDVRHELDALQRQLEKLRGLLPQ